MTGVDDEVLRVLSDHCACISDITISHCLAVTDDGIKHLIQALWLEKIAMAYCRITDTAVVNLVQVRRKGEREREKRNEKRGRVEREREKDRERERDYIRIIRYTLYAIRYTQNTY